MGIDYLSGYSEYEDKVEHVRFGTGTEYYVDDVKAIMRVAIYRDDAFFRWEEKVFPLPMQRQMMRTEIAMLKLGGNVTDLGDARIEIDRTHICSFCDGLGSVPDIDGDLVACRWCDGQGVY